MVFLVKNSTKKGAKIQNEYLFLLKCIMATSWVGNIYFSQSDDPTKKGAKFEMSTYFYSNVIWLESGFKMSPLDIFFKFLKFSK